MKAERIGDLLADPVWDSDLLPELARDLFHMLLRYMLASDIDKLGFERNIQRIENEQRKAEAMTLAQQYRQEGRVEGILASRRQDVLEALEIRFDQLPPGLREAVEAIADLEKLRALHRAAIRSATLEEFSALL